jgi:DNA-binding transcriptional regulator YhcF (GntR family)
VSADRDITPRVVAHIRAELPHIDAERRTSPIVAQLVLRQLARWARQAGEPGQWTTTESVAQLRAGTGIPAGTIRRALDNLERVGLVVTLKRGGGQGVTARGSTRLLLLDPASTARGNRAEFRPQLRAVDGSTARGTASTARGEPRDTASSSATSSTRALPADDSYIPDYVRERWADRLGGPT